MASKRVADPEPVVGAPALVDHRLLGGQLGEQLLRALAPVQGEHLGGRRRVDQRQEPLAGALDVVLGVADRRGDLDPVDPGHRVDGRDRDVREPVGVGDDQIAGERLVDRIVDRAAQPGGEDGDEGDQRESDHQCRRGGGGAARVADRVLPRQAPRHSAQPLERAADQRRQGRDQARAPQGDADEHGARADPDPRLARIEGAEQPQQHPGDAEHRERDRGHGAQPPLARGRDYGALAQPGHGRHAGRAHRGDQRRDDGQRGPEHEAEDHRARLHHRAGGGEIDLDRVEERLDHAGRSRSRRAGRPPTRADR